MIDYFFCTARCLENIFCTADKLFVCLVICFFAACISEVRTQHNNSVQYRNKSEKKKKGRIAIKLSKEGLGIGTTPDSQRSASSSSSQTSSTSSRSGSLSSHGSALHFSRSSRFTKMFEFNFGCSIYEFVYFQQTAQAVPVPIRTPAVA